MRARAYSAAACARSAPEAAKSYKRIRIGSDCAGLNGTALALESPNIAYAEVFASDVDPKARSVLSMNFKLPEERKPGVGIVYDDCATRDVAADAPVDLYTAGFPCQPCSRQGQRKGPRTSAESAWSARLWSA